MVLGLGWIEAGSKLIRCKFPFLTNDSVRFSVLAVGGRWRVEMSHVAAVVGRLWIQDPTLVGILIRRSESDQGTGKRSQPPENLSRVIIYAKPPSFAIHFHQQEQGGRAQWAFYRHHEDANTLVYAALRSLRLLRSSCGKKLLYFLLPFLMMPPVVTGGPALSTWTEALCHSFRITESDKVTVVVEAVNVSRLGDMSMRGEGERHCRCCQSLECRVQNLSVLVVSSCRLYIALYSNCVCLWMWIVRL